MVKGSAGVGMLRVRCLFLVSFTIVLIFFSSPISFFLSFFLSLFSGKSQFGLFLLYQAIREKRPTLYWHQKHNLLLLFHQDCVYSLSNLPSTKIVSEQMLLIADGNGSSREVRVPSLDCTVVALNHLYRAVKRLDKTDHPLCPRYYLPPLSQTEIQAMKTLMLSPQELANTNEKNNEEDNVMKQYQLWGGQIPRALSSSALSSFSSSSSSSSWSLPSHREIRNWTFPEVGITTSQKDPATRDGWPNRLDSQNIAAEVRGSEFDTVPIFLTQTWAQKPPGLRPLPSDHKFYKRWKSDTASNAVSDLLISGFLESANFATVLNNLKHNSQHTDFVLDSLAKRCALHSLAAPQLKYPVYRLNNGKSNPSVLLSPAEAKELPSFSYKEFRERFDTDPTSVPDSFYLFSDSSSSLQLQDFYDLNDLSSSSSTKESPSSSVSSVSSSTTSSSSSSVLLTSTADSIRSADLDGVLPYGIPLAVEFNPNRKRVTRIAALEQLAHQSRFAFRCVYSFCCSRNPSSCLSFFLFLFLFLLFVRFQVSLRVGCRYQESS
jgi:hypothetical protein